MAFVAHITMDTFNCGIQAKRQKRKMLAEMRIKERNKET